MTCSNWRPSWQWQMTMYDLQRAKLYLVYVLLLLAQHKVAHQWIQHILSKQEKSSFCQNISPWWLLYREVTICLNIIVDIDLPFLLLVIEKIDLVSFLLCPCSRSLPDIYTTPMCLLLQSFVQFRMLVTLYLHFDYLPYILINELSLQQQQSMQTLTFKWRNYHL